MFHSDKFVDRREFILNEVAKVNMENQHNIPMNKIKTTIAYLNLQEMVGEEQEEEQEDFGEGYFAKVIIK